jgi:hypothetical protein
MNKSIDLSRIRSALKGKDLVGFNVAGDTAASVLRTVQVSNPQGGRAKASALRIGIKKSGATKVGLTKT